MKSSERAKLRRKPVNLHFEDIKAKINQKKEEINCQKENLARTQEEFNKKCDKVVDRIKFLRESSRRVFRELPFMIQPSPRSEQHSFEVQFSPREPETSIHCNTSVLLDLIGSPSTSPKKQNQVDNYKEKLAELITKFEGSSTCRKNLEESSESILSTNTSENLLTNEFTRVIEDVKKQKEFVQESQELWRKIIDQPYSSSETLNLKKNLNDQLYWSRFEKLSKRDIIDIYRRCLTHLIHDNERILELVTQNNEMVLMTLNHILKLAEPISSKIIDFNELIQYQEEHYEKIKKQNEIINIEIEQKRVEVESIKNRIKIEHEIHSNELMNLTTFYEKEMSHIADIFNNKLQEKEQRIEDCKNKIDKMNDSFQNLRTNMDALQRENISLGEKLVALQFSLDDQRNLVSYYQYKLESLQANMKKSEEKQKREYEDRIKQLLEKIEIIKNGGVCDV